MKNTNRGNFLQTISRMFSKEPKLPLQVSDLKKINIDWLAQYIPQEMAEDLENKQLQEEGKNQEKRYVPDGKKVIYEVMDSLQGYEMIKGIIWDSQAKTFKQYDGINTYIDEKGPFFVSKKPISLYEAIKVVHESKGIAVIAHLGEYHFSVDEKKVFIKDCLDHSIDGFECYHPLNQIEDINLLTGCQQQNPALILTAGSDYHGTNKKNNFLGISCVLDLLSKQKEQFNQITTNAYNFFIKL